MGEHVKVTIRVEIGDLAKEFDAIAATSGDAHEVVKGLIDGLHSSANKWINEQRNLRF